MKKGYVYTVIFMLLVSIFFTAILGTADGVLKARIHENRNFAEQKAILSGLDVDSPNDPEAVAELFAERLVPETLDESIYYRLTDDDGATEAYAVPYSGSGLWGTIRGYVGVSADLETLKGIVFTEQNETPGLGGRIQEDWFKEQFRGLDLSAGAPPKYGDFAGQTLDAVTGATQTSNAILRILENVTDEILPALAAEIGLE